MLYSGHLEFYVSSTATHTICLFILLAKILHVVQHSVSHYFSHCAQEQSDAKGSQGLCCVAVVPVMKCFCLFVCFSDVGLFPLDIGIWMIFFLRRARGESRSIAPEGWICDFTRLRKLSGCSSAVMGPVVPWSRAWLHTVRTTQPGEALSVLMHHSLIFWTCPEVVLFCCQRFL